MKPLNYDKSTCSPVSSNCVIWQGPDIECINLCKGDTITDVVYKLATELCNIMDTFDMSQYDLKCFAEGVCPPATFKVFIQNIIDKICALQACNPDCIPGCNTPAPTPQVAARTMAVQSSSFSSDSTVFVAEPFWYTNQYGDTVTTMSVSEYAVAIGNRVANNISDIASIQKALASQSQRISALEKAPVPTLQLPTVTPKGILPKIATDMDVVLESLEAQFVQLRNATGTPNEIYTNVQKQPAGLNEAKSLANPSATMSSLNGWTSNVANEADTVGNIWITIADLRAAVQNLVATYIPSECSNISLNFVATYANNIITLYITGNIPAYFQNTNSFGTSFKIADTLGNSFTTPVDIISVINNPTGYSISLTSTSINVNSNLTITAEPSFTSVNSGSECKSVLAYTIVNQAACPVVTYIPSNNSIAFEFTSEAGVREYTIELYESLKDKPVNSQTITTSSVTDVKGSFTELTENTAYTARVLVLTNGVTTTCSLVAVSTLIISENK